MFNSVICNMCVWWWCGFGLGENGAGRRPKRAAGQNGEAGLMAKLARAAGEKFLGFLFWGFWFLSVKF